MSDAQSPSTMPERYRPDPWIDSQYGCRDAQKSTVIRVPTIAVRDWLGLAEGDHVTVTQADLASRIGSAREVISRRLDGLAQRGWVRRDRGHVTLLDRAALARLARIEAES